MTALALLLLAAAAQPGIELAGRFDPARGRICELEIGAQRARIGVPMTRFEVFPEGMREYRYRARLCGNRVRAVLSFNESRRLERVSLQQRGACLRGLCIGERYRALRARARARGLRVLLSREEGSFFSLRAERDGISYAFDVGAMEGACFDSPDACPEQLDRARLDAINIYRPAD